MLWYGGIELLFALGRSDKELDAQLSALLKFDREKGALEEKDFDPLRTY